MDYSKMDSAAAANFVKGKHVAIVGFQKSGMDIAMECSTVNGVERPCSVVIRTPHWNVPDYFPWGFPMAKLYLNRFSELTVHKPGEGLLLYLMATIFSPLYYIDLFCSNCIEMGVLKICGKPYKTQAQAFKTRDGARA
ncbi:hypothetical protein BC332_34897 [Capsicum chinense]|nr:hypothetical protein BC332_34897 [Capsicum chinense]